MKAENEELQRRFKEIGSFIAAFYRQNEEIFKQLAEVLSSAPTKIRDAQDKLFPRGWYILGEHDFTDLEQINTLSTEEIDNLMERHARNITEKTFEGLYKQFPSRATVFQDIVEVHRQKKFTLSIPMMLIQADGICFDLLGVSLYSKQNGNPKTKKAKDELFNKEILNEGIWSTLYLRPLDIVTSISINTYDRDQIRKTDSNFGPLNRHEIIHGKNLEYATEQNSLRCIVLLGYLADLKRVYFKL